MHLSCANLCGSKDLDNDQTLFLDWELQIPISQLEEWIRSKYSLFCPHPIFLPTMDIDTAYQKTLSAARLEVKNTKRDWTIQHHKRKAERTAQEDEEIRGRWITAKDNLEELMASRPKGL